VTLTLPSHSNIAALVPMHWQIEQPDFRCSSPYAVKDAHGNVLMLRLCEELVEGRWEPFVSMCREFETAPAYPN